MTISYRLLPKRLSYTSWTDGSRLGLQFIVYKIAEQDWLFVNLNLIVVAHIWLAYV